MKNVKSVGQWDSLFRVAVKSAFIDSTKVRGWRTLRKDKKAFGPARLFFAQFLMFFTQVFNKEMVVRFFGSPGAPIQAAGGRGRGKKNAALVCAARVSRI